MALSKLPVLDLLKKKLSRFAGSSSFFSPLIPLQPFKIRTESIQHQPFERIQILQILQILQTVPHQH